MALPLQAGPFELVAGMAGSLRLATSIKQAAMCAAAAPDPSQWLLDARRLLRRWDAGTAGVMRIQMADRCGVTHLCYWL